MSVRPIDIKTSLMGNDEASRLRENQKAQEAGLAENLAQNKNAHAKKTESVQKTETTEGRVVREDEEESEKQQRNNSPQTAKQAKEDKEEEEEKKHPNIPDGTRGLKIDIKI